MEVAWVWWEAGMGSCIDIVSQPTARRDGVVNTCHYPLTSIHWEGYLVKVINRCVKVHRHLTRLLYKNGNNLFGKGAKKEYKTKELKGKDLLDILNERSIGETK